MKKEMDMQSTVLFLDTNVLLHYPPLKDIDWKALAGAPSVQLVMCMQVIHELDEKKDHPRLGERARRAIKEVRELGCSGEPVRDGVTLEVFSYEIRSKDFPGSLSIDSKDDQVVHLVKKYVQTTAAESVAVVSEDYGMMLRCEANGVDCIEMDSTMRLESPADAVTKELRKTKLEVERLRRRLPDLIIRVRPPGADENEAEFRAKLGPEAEPMNIEAKMGEIVEQYPKQKIEHQSPLAVAAITGSITPEELIRYNRDLGRFYSDYRDYLEKEKESSELLARAITFEVVLENRGTSPASDVDVSLYLPDRFSQVTTLEEAERMQPQPPKPPDPTIKGLFPQLARSLRCVPQPLVFPRSTLDAISRVGANVSEPEIIQESPFRINLHATRLKHLFECNLGAFLAVFLSWDDVSPFEMGYYIVAEELPVAAEGKVPLLVTRKDTEAD